MNRRYLFAFSLSGLLMLLVSGVELRVSSQVRKGS
jgi:hypothetical protein